MISSIQGINNAQALATKAAVSIANPNSSESLVENLIQLKQAEISTEANAKVIQSENDRIGTILDISV